MTDTWQRDDYTISTDRSRLDLDLIHNYLSNESYWATGRSREVGCADTSISRCRAAATATR